MKPVFFILFFLISFSIFATHNRAGEITYTQISQLEYEVTVITYTNTLSPADRQDLEIRWGDDTKSIISRIEEIYLPDNMKRNKYVGRHSYPGPGTFILVVEDPNRNWGVQNIPNSVNVVFSIKTFLQINSEIGFNNTPVLTTPPIDKAAVGKLFIHNPGAYDPDGDSLSYKLTKCTGENGEEIPGYSFPETSSAFYVNEVTGDLVWDAPVRKGIYNVAMFIEEWRFGKRISKIERDMQIEVYDVDNNPPQIMVDDKYCVEADSTLKFYVSASDNPDEKITLSAMGGPFLVSDTRASFPNGISDTGFVSGLFEWNTNCLHVRKQPYSVIFKAQDNNPFLNLVCQKNVNIFVIAPSPKNVALAPSNNTITVTWDPCRCPNTAGYRIYRKTDSSGYVPGPCETGVPASTGYVQIAEVTGINTISYIDNNNGLGLAQGYNYCYMIIAFFADGAESYASNEVCSDLVRGIPVITNVSVNATDTAHGSIYLAWAKPTELDTLPSNPNGPYKYLIYRSNDIWGAGTTLIDSLSDLNDTTYIDTLINTLDFPHAYRIELYNDSIGKRFLIGAPSIASSVFLKITPSDNKLTLLFDKNVPWQNMQYTIYRKNEITNSFDSLNTVNTTSFEDSLLSNGKSYCYLIKSIGKYNISGFIDPILNYSQISCASPIDTVPPCNPDIKVQSFCDSLYNKITWNNPNLTCSNDVIKYNIYYAPSLNDSKQLIATIQPASITEYAHFPTQTLAGCYYVTAIDSFLNESRNPLTICIDSCSHYKLPNIFTPNNDGVNDLFKPIDNHFVVKVDLKIYDRWGLVVFQTDNPEINWDGHHLDNNKLVSSGVYYYVCDIYENRLTGLEHRTLLGFVQIIGKEGAIQK